MITDLFDLHDEVLYLLEPDMLGSMTRMQERADTTHDPVMRQHYLDGVEYVKYITTDRPCASCATAVG